MRWYQGYKRANKVLDEMFETSKPSNPISVESKSEPYTLMLYRGFDFDPAKMVVRDGKYVLSPRKSEQGLIWFSHDMQRIWNMRAVDYAKTHGSYLLSYPLTINKMYDLVTYEDGTTSTRPPSDMEIPDSTENQRVMCSMNACYELPEGFVFTYKTEKFIGCSMDLLVDPSMISKIEQEPEEPS